MGTLHHPDLDIDSGSSRSVIIFSFPILLQWTDHELILVGNNLFLGFWTSQSIHGFRQGDYMAVYAALGKNPRENARSRVDNFNRYGSGDIPVHTWFRFRVSHRHLVLMSPRAHVRLAVS